MKATLYVYPPGFEAVDGFTARLRTWGELLASQPLTSLFPTHNERNRILSQGALFENPTDSTTVVESVTVAPGEEKAGGGGSRPFKNPTSGYLQPSLLHKEEQL